MKIYVASSWRNPRQMVVVDLLRKAGHEVYDYRNPRPGENGFHWSNIDPGWKTWDAGKFREGLSHPVANYGFANDRNALVAADATVLVLPCGRSAHLELGWAIGLGQFTVVMMWGNVELEPELMYKAASVVCIGTGELLDAIQRYETRVECQSGVRT